MENNDVLPLKAARRDAILLTLKRFLEHRDTSDSISMVAFTFSMRRHLIRLASAPFTSFRLAPFGCVPFADLRVRRMATKHGKRKIYRGWVNTPVPFQAVCGLKFIKFWDNVGDPSCFPVFSVPRPIVYGMFHSEDIRH